MLHHVTSTLDAAHPAHSQSLQTLCCGKKGEKMGKNTFSVLSTDSICRLTLCGQVYLGRQIVGRWWRNLVGDCCVAHQPVTLFTLWSSQCSFFLLRSSFFSCMLFLSVVKLTNSWKDKILLCLSAATKFLLILEYLLFLHRHWDDLHALARQWSLEFGGAGFITNGPPTPNTADLGWGYPGWGNFEQDRQLFDRYVSLLHSFYPY